MPLRTAQLVIDRNSLPQKWDDLGVRFEQHTVAKTKTTSPAASMVLIKPAGALLGPDQQVGPEPRWNSIMCGMKLKAQEGTDVQGKGQLIVTGQRFIGMVDDGIATGGIRLSMETSGNILCFAFRRDDVHPAQVKKRRLTPSDFTFHSTAEQPIAFQFHIFMAMVYIANDKMGYWQDSNMRHVLSEDGRQGLLKS